MTKFPSAVKGNYNETYVVTYAQVYSMFLARSHYTSYYLLLFIKASGGIVFTEARATNHIA